MFNPNTQQMHHHQQTYQPAQINLGGVVPPPSNQSKRTDMQNAQAYYVAAQQLADYDSLARGKNNMK